MGFDGAYRENSRYSPQQIAPGCLLIVSPARRLGRRLNWELHDSSCLFKEKKVSVERLVPLGRFLRDDWVSKVSDAFSYW